MAVRSFVALGANVGDRARTIHRAVQALQKYGTVEATASLVESAAAYVTEQPPFLNTVCALRTSLKPLELLSALKTVERDLGAFTGAQPSSVRLSSLPTTLLCDRAGGEQQVALTLTSAAEAAALTWTQPLPWCMEASTWAERAIDPERAPESRAIAAL